MSSLQKALVNQKKSSLQSALAREMSSGKRDRSRRNNPPTVTTTHESSDSSSDDSSSSSSETDDEIEEIKGQDMMKIRQEAIKLVNTPSSGPNAEATKKRHGPQTFVSPYQQSRPQSQPQSHRQFSAPAAFASPISSYQSSAPSSSSPFPMQNPTYNNTQPAHTAEKLTMTDMFVNCVSEVCKSSSSEILSKVLSSGYRSVNNYENPPVNGSWGDIDTSQHGYGNGNNAPPSFAQSSASKSSGNMPARYQD